MAKPRAYIFELSDAQRAALKHVQKKATSDYAKVRCSIVLAADESRRQKPLTYKQIANRVGCCENTVIATLKEYCESDGKLSVVLKPARSEKSDTSNLKVDGELEARMIKMACSKPPEGYDRWTLVLYSEYSVVGLEIEEPLSPSTWCRTLKRNHLQPHKSTYWCIPPEEDAEFVARMEDVLDVYAMPYNPLRPVWCMDEKPYQILGETREPIGMKPCFDEKIDCEYVRNGTVSITCMIQPHTGIIRQFVEPTRTAVDWAEKARILVDEIEPNAEKIILVCDNLNIHNISSLYKAFPPDEARRIAKKLEIHYTPVHGSWLDIAEIGIHIMTVQCLDRRIPSIEVLRKELKAWEKSHNSKCAPVKWQFGSEDARKKLYRLYPNFDEEIKKRDELRESKLAKQSKKTGSSKAAEQSFADTTGEPAA